MLFELKITSGIIFFILVKIMILKRINIFNYEKALSYNNVILMISFIFLWSVKKHIRDKLILSHDSIPEKAKFCKPVGSGWSLFLNKGRYDTLCRETLPYGLLKNGRWGSATRIKDVQQILSKENKTLFSYPSIENGTLGGWIASGSHGSGGTLWKPSIGKVNVFDRETGQSHDVDANTVFSKSKSIKDVERYLIIDVEIIPHEDIWLDKIVSKVSNIADCEKFLNDESCLRMLQIGRRGIMALIWIPSKNDLSHEDPHFFSRYGLYLQSDIFSIIQNSNARQKEWFDFPVEDIDNFKSNTKLSEANKYTPEPSLFTIPFGLLYKNFEIFVFDISLSGEKLYTISNGISDLLTTEFSGRCELRCGKTILFLDICLWYTHDHLKCYESIVNIVGKDYKKTLHRGKFQFTIQDDHSI